MRSQRTQSPSSLADCVHNPLYSTTCQGSSALPPVRNDELALPNVCKSADATQKPLCRPSTPPGTGDVPSAGCERAAVEISMEMAGFNSGASCCQGHPVPVISARKRSRRCGGGGVARQRAGKWSPLTAPHAFSSYIKEFDRLLEMVLRYLLQAYQGCVPK